MTEPERIAHLMRKMTDGDPWHGPPLAKVLDGVTAEQAAAKPIAGAHSIWELLLHVMSWHAIVRRRFAGEKVKITQELNWPVPSEVSEKAWRRDAAAALAGAKALADAVSVAAQARLDAPIAEVPDAPTFYEQLHGVLQHDAWHTGQMSLLRRALGSPVP